MEAIALCNLLKLMGQRSKGLLASSKWLKPCIRHARPWTCCSPEMCPVSWVKVLQDCSSKASSRRVIVIKNQKVPWKVFSAASSLCLHRDIKSLPYLARLAHTSCQRGLSKDKMLRASWIKIDTVTLTTQKASSGSFSFKNFRVCPA